MNNKQKCILIAAGEASGDLHASHLVKNTNKIAPNIKFSGMGGTLMRTAGVEILVDINELSIVGAQDIIGHFPKILQALRYLKTFIKTNPPALVILVDYAGFNLRLAKIAKRAGIKVFYYISPKVWAWQQSRIKKLKKYVDLMAVIFPFEVAYFKQFAIPAVFVGNPSITSVKPTLTVDKAKRKFNLNPNAKTIGLLPGSRKSEIKYLLPIMLSSAQLLQKHYPELQFVLPLASSLSEKDLSPYLATTNIPITITKNQPYDTIQICDAIIAASGTATLEIALLSVPMVIIYKSSFINYLLAKLFLKIPYLGLCNILLQRCIVKELLQYKAKPAAIAKEIITILDDNGYREQMIKNLNEVRPNLTSLPPQSLEELVVRYSR
jgi:lipid-A-disaccharide synthase